MKTGAGGVKGKFTFLQKRTCGGNWDGEGMGEVFQILQLLRLGDLNLSNSILNINISNFRVPFSRCLDTIWEWKLLVLSLSPNFPSQTILPEISWYEFCIPIG